MRLSSTICCQLYPSRPGCHSAWRLLALVTWRLMGACCQNLHPGFFFLICSVVCPLYVTLQSSRNWRSFPVTVTVKATVRRSFCAGLWGSEGGERRDNSIARYTACPKICWPGAWKRRQALHRKKKSPLKNGLINTWQQSSPVLPVLLLQPANFFARYFFCHFPVITDDIKYTFSTRGDILLPNHVFLHRLTLSSFSV